MLVLYSIHRARAIVKTYLALSSALLFLVIAASGADRGRYSMVLEWRFAYLSEWRTLVKAKITLSKHELVKP